MEGTFETPESVEDGSILKDRYEILRELGRGGFSITYLSNDRQTGQLCVVKSLALRHIDTFKAKELFEREAKVLSHLDHPNIPRFVELFTKDSPEGAHIYLVQEFKEGQNLQELVRQGKRFTEQDAIGIALQITNILEYLQKYSPPIIHRDIKPSNVLIGKDGQVHLIDFGAVRDKILHEPAFKAEGPTIVGTYGYMPLEQFEGRAVPASDIYSLGATLIYLLSHKDPWEMEKEAMKIDFRPHVSVSPAFSRILERMIDPDDEKRYNNAATLRKDLEAFTQKKVTGKEKGLPRILIATLSIALIAAVMFGILRERKAPVFRSVPEMPAITDVNPPGTAVQFGSSKLRHGQAIRSLDLSADGKYLASGSDDKRVILWDAATGNQLHSFDFWNDVSSVAFSPDGKRLAAAGRDNTVIVWNVESGNPLFRLLGPQGHSNYSPYYYPLAFSPDGKTLAAQGMPQSVQLWNAETGDSIRTLTGPADKIEEIQFSPDGKKVFAITRSGAIRSWAWETGKEIHSANIPQEYRHNISPDCKIIASYGISTLDLHDAENGKEIGSYYSPKTIQAFAFSKDASLVAMGDGPDIQVIESATKKLIYKLHGHHENVSALVFSGDGKRLYSGGFDNQIRIWNLENGTEVYIPEGHSAPVRTLAFSPDGKVLVSGSDDSTTRQWDVASGKEIAKRQWEAPITWIGFIPEKRFVVAHPTGFHTLDLSTNYEIAEVAFGDRGYGVALSPDGKRIAIGGESSIQIRDLSSGEKLLEIQDEEARKSLGLAFSKDGKYLASAKGERKAFLWDSSTGKKLSTMAGFDEYDRSGTVHFTQDGKHLIVGGLYTKFWSLLEDGKLRYATMAQGGSETILSPDGKMLARVDTGDFRNIKLSRLIEQNGHGVYQNMPPLKGHHGPIYALQFSPGSSLLASAGADGTILLWDLSKIENTIRPSAVVSGSQPQIDLDFNGRIEGTGIIPTRLSPESDMQPYVQGQNGKGYKMLGRNTFPETEKIVFQDDYTVQFWFRLDDTQVQRKYTNLIRSDLVHVDVRDGGDPYVFVLFPYHGGHNGLSLKEKTGRLQADKWYHLGIVYDHSNKLIRIYWQGDLIMTDQESNPSFRLGQLELGQYPDQQPVGTTVVDELKVFAAVRTHHEIATDAGNNSPRDRSRPDLPIAANQFIQIHEYPAFQVYQPTGELSNARIRDLDVYGDQLWAATTEGILHYNMITRSWSFYGNNVGIPGEIVTHIAGWENLVVADLSSTGQPGVYHAMGSQIFEPSNRRWREIAGNSWSYQREGENLWISTSQGAEFRDMKIGQTTRYNKETTGLIHNEVSKVLTWGDEVWFACRGDWINEKVRFRNGGISCLNRKTGKWTSFSRKNGMSQDYSVAIAVDEREVWVSHWAEDAGLSLLNRETGKWSDVKKSTNGIELGGISLALDGNNLWIGQQQGFVKYDRTSGNAVWYERQQGVPGNIVNRIVPAGDYVWVAVYGHDGSGIIRIPRK